jgi:Predicted nucleotide-binding protein containing TIR-like domain
MTITRRVYVSLPADHWLPDNLNALKWAIVDQIEDLGYTPEVFTNPKGKPGLASSRAWGARDADEVARRCMGAAIIGLCRWKFKDTAGAEALLPTEFNHYEGALARTLGLPTLVLVQQDVKRRVVFDPTFGGFVGDIPPTAGLDWLKSPEFRVPFGYWRTQLSARRDIFLGYCGKSRETAASLKYFIQSNGGSVLDWQTDFIAGRSILAQIEEAASRCNAGIFLFTKDDDFAEGQPDTSAPRDNVVFEAGYFIGLKGKRNVLIVREIGSKMPADLGGDIYALLPDKVDIGPIERIVSGFMGAL